MRDACDYRDAPRTDASFAFAWDEIQPVADFTGSAVELHDGLDIPFERSQILLRCGVALAAAGDRDTALERLAEAYRLARTLRATPLATEIAAELVALGASLEELLGRRAAADHEHAGLSRRELEVMRLAAGGLTNREMDVLKLLGEGLSDADIGARLYITPKTAGHHVGAVLAKLDVHTRHEAARKLLSSGNR